MEKEKEVKLEELNDEVQSSGIPKEIHSVTVANTGAVTADSARIDILGGVARVVARNSEQCLALFAKRPQNVS